MILLKYLKLTPKSWIYLSLQIACVMLLTIGTTGPLQAAENIQTATLQDGTELTLNGIGRAKKLSDTFYIGALYLQQPFRSVDNITYINNYKRMRIKIASKRVSARRFAQYWKEAISINNPRNVWEPQVKDVLAFTSFFKKTLITGDVIDLDFIPASGTYVHINGVAMGRVRNPGFYNLIIMAWLGNRPPNEQFKLGVMGGNDGETALKLQQDFESLTPSAKRITESKGWLQDTPATPAKKTVAKKSKSKKTVVKKPKATNKKVVKNTAKKTPSKKKAADVKSKSKTKAVSNGGKPATKTILAAIPAVKTPTVKITTKQKAKPLAKAKKVPEEPKELTSSQKLQIYAVRSGYEKTLRQTIRKYQQYPIRKMLRNRTYKKQMERGPIESEGILWVKIARSGAVISSRLEKSTGISILDESAVTMVEKADPLPEMPKELEGGEFEFFVQLKFVSPQLN